MNAFKVSKLSLSAAFVALTMLSAGCYYVPASGTYYDYDDGSGYYYRPYPSYSYYVYGYPYYYGYPRYYGPSTSLSIDIIGGSHVYRDHRSWRGVPNRDHHGDWRGNRRGGGHDRRSGGHERHGGGHRN